MEKKNVSTDDGPAGTAVSDPGTPAETETAETAEAAETSEAAKNAETAEDAEAAEVAEDTKAAENAKDAEDTEKVAEAPEPSGKRRSRLAWARDPLVIALVLVVAGTALLVRAGQLRGGTAAENRALTDVERTERVIGDVSNDLGRIFSYTYADTATTEQAAREVLAGRAADQYRTLFGQVKQRAAAQQLTLTSRVVRAGVISMDGRDARLLVFLDQTARRRDKPEGTTAAAQLVVTARFADEQWRIIDIRAR